MKSQLAAALVVLATACQGVPAQRVGPWDVALGPQAADPGPPEGEEAIYSGVLELTVPAGEERDVGLTIPKEAFSCADSNTHFTWSVRRPYPAPPVAVEFFYERQGAHESLGYAPTGRAVVSVCSPVDAINRMNITALVEVRYLFTNRR